MDAWSQRLAGSLVCVIVLLISTGCSNSDAEGDGDQPPYAASGGVTPGEPGSVSDGAPQGSSEEDPMASQSPQDSTAEPAERNGDPSGLGRSFDHMKPPASTGDVATPFTIEGSEPEIEPKTATLTELRADLSPEKLLDFLSVADADMQLIVAGRSGIEDPKQARRTLLHIVKMKLEASRRLAAHEDSNDRAKAEGARGELQALSHLAALGDLKAAEELEELATTQMNSDDAQLVSDSRLVLIGFAIESLQNGVKDAPERIVRYVDQIATSDVPPDVASMMVMGQARDLLERYGHQDQARAVRDQIIELFADSSEPQIAEMAARLAGNVKFDGIDELLKNVMDGETVETSMWVAAGETLITESPDVQTVKYLCGAAVDLEANGFTNLADATYELMMRRFTEANAATTNEVQLASQAYQARKSVIGDTFTPDLDSVDGSPLNLDDYRGKVVLVPFWAMSFPPSLQVIPQLRAITDQHPEQVAIVGVNMDADGEPIAEFARQQNLGFRNFKSGSDLTVQIAGRFGIVSLPFTAVLGPDGRVEAIDFTGKKLKPTVDRLLAR
ncbi:MAG: TlpA disulfide reductase family protein [Planctomycetota bacterium]